EVVIPSYVCDALHHAVRRVGAIPVLADADPATLSLSAKDAEARLTERTRCLIVPHAFGLAADLAPFLALGVPVIEDCAQALAARYRARLVGAPCALPPEVGPRHVFHRFVVEIERAPDAVQAALAARGVAARRPVFRPAHRALRLSGFPEADRLWQRALSIPCYPTLT